MEEFEKNWKRLEIISLGQHSLWKRLVDDNKELQDAIRNLRRRFDLWEVEIPATIVEFREKMFSDNSERYQQFVDELEELKSKFDLPLEFSNEMYLYVAYKKRPFLRMGFPEGKIGLGKGEVIIDEMVDVTNPLVIEHIIDMQRRFIFAIDPPPRPEKIGRKNNWQPVLDWHRRYPSVSVKALAEFLGYNRSYLSRKINELVYEK